MIFKQLLVLLGSAPRLLSREGLSIKGQNTYLQKLGAEMEIGPRSDCPDTPEQLLKQLPSSAVSPVDEPVRDATKTDMTLLCLSGAPHLVLKGILPLWNYSSDSPWKSISSPYCWIFFFSSKHMKYKPQLESVP